LAAHDEVIVRSLGDGPGCLDSFRAFVAAVGIVLAVIRYLPHS
jgi:hypothetical protein